MAGEFVRRRVIPFAEDIAKQKFERPGAPTNWYALIPPRVYFKNLEELNIDTSVGLDYIDAIWRLIVDRTLNMEVGLFTVRRADRLQIEPVLDEPRPDTLNVDLAHHFVTALNIVKIQNQELLASIFPEWDAKGPRIVIEIYTDDASEFVNELLHEAIPALFREESGVISANLLENRMNMKKRNVEALNVLRDPLSSTRKRSRPNLTHSSGKRRALPLNIISSYIEPALLGNTKNLTTPLSRLVRNTRKRNRKHTRRFPQAKSLS